MKRIQTPELQGSELKADGGAPCNYDIVPFSTLCPADRLHRSPSSEPEEETEVNDNADQIAASAYRARQLKALRHCIELLTQLERPRVISATGFEMVL
eukprot:265250-Hanusia_phi.AAC.1